MKAGIKTTEFWSTIFGSIIIAGTDELGIHLSETTVTAIVTMVIAYIAERLFNKKIEINQENKTNTYNNEEK
ncbi:MAG: hypothetical protein II453_09715 [Alphaproteobacteria bacterium]|nr:hypothetical protein [Alphaproteobacteria bacterium]